MIAIGYEIWLRMLEIKRTTKSKIIGKNEHFRNMREFGYDNQVVYL